jgi:hypothetical protein
MLIVTHNQPLVAAGGNGLREAADLVIAVGELGAVIRSTLLSAAAAHHLDGLTESYQ